MTLNIFEKNLETISHTYIPLYEKIKKKIASENLPYEDFTLTFKEGCHEGKSPLTNKQDVTQSDIVITYGFGTNPSFLEELHKKNSSAFILVFESSLLFFIRLLTKYDFEKILTNDKIKISVEENPGIAVKRDLEEYFGILTLSDFITIKSSFSIKLNPEYYKEIDQILEEVKKSALLNQETIKLFSKEWTQNIFSNLKTFATYPGINALFDKFKGLPGIIISAGPSLDKNIKWLKHIEGRAVVIAVDSAYRTLLSEKIEVNFVLSLDSQIKNYLHLEDTGNYSENTILVMNPVVFPKTPESFKGRILNMASNIPLIKWLETYVGEKGEPLVGGSVSTASFDFARKIGCDPIILIGQDLSFPGKRAYATGSFFCKSFENQIGREIPLDTLNSASISSRGDFNIENFFGLQVPTTYEMTSWKEWFQNICGEEECVNSTEGGLDIKGFNFISLGNAARLYCKDHFPIEEIYRKSLSAFQTPDLKPLLKKLTEFFIELKRIKEKAANGKQNSLKLINCIEKNPGSFKDYLSEFKRLEFLASELLEYEDFIEINQWEINSLLKKISSFLQKDSLSKQSNVNFQNNLNKIKAYYELFKEIDTISEFSIAIVEKGIKGLNC